LALAIGSAYRSGYSDENDVTVLKRDKVREQMTANSGEAAANHWTVARLLELFDVEAESQDRYIAPTGIADADERQVVEGTQVLAQVIVAATKRFEGKSIRSVHSVFARAVLVGPPVILDIDVVSEGRSTASAIPRSRISPINSCSGESTREYSLGRDSARWSL
jgi:hypothetical protein